MNPAADLPHATPLTSPSSVPPLSREAQRHAAQLAFVASGEDLQVGSAADCPCPPAQLAATTGREPYVVQDLGGGLTAHVYRLRLAGQDWTLKRARERCLVNNVDGQTSFLNEVQRRADISAVQRNPATADRLAQVVATQYASYRQGIILSPWIAGVPITEWTETRLRQLFAVLSELLLAGLFEWDLCGGNLLDDGQIRLFDFGYMYRFDPLTEFNSNGLADPLFHGAERFETRHFFAYLLQLEQTQGTAAALAAFRLEKTIALAAYEKLWAQLQARGASAVVLHWWQAIIQRWRQALAGDLPALYLSEGWRSHRLDLDDDLRGQTCTPMTLRRLHWLQQAVREHWPTLQRLQALFWHDAELSAQALQQELAEAEIKVQRWQVQPRAAG